MVHLAENLNLRWYIAVDNHYRKNKVLVLIAENRHDAVEKARQQLKDEYAVLRKAEPATWELTLVGSEPASNPAHATGIRSWILK